MKLTKKSLALIGITIEQYAEFCKNNNLNVTDPNTKKIVFNGILNNNIVFNQELNRLVYVRNPEGRGVQI